MTFLCQKVWTEEWSGMLFYTTEGQFGDEDFSVTARGLFLLDIGTATYTEYDPADPEVIKFLMANPSVLAMKKGHIHSHNNMGVFFSSTDNDELADNCGFHNFYLSLIVNNKNEMCAKIAFKAKTTSENKVTMFFLDQNGKEKQKNLTGKNENEAIYVYKCEVIKHLEAVEDTFKSRFQELKEAKDKAALKRVSEAATSQHIPYSKDWHNGQGISQGRLFDDARGTVRSFKEEEEMSKKHGILGSVGGVGRIPVVDRSIGGKADPRVHSMLTKLVSLDFLYEGSLRAILGKLNAEFYPGEEEYPTTRDPFGPHVYYDAVEKRAIDFYMSAFPEDVINLKYFDRAMEQAVEMLELYEDDFPELVHNLAEAINLEIR